MQTSDLIAQARSLPFEQKLRLVEALWDAIADDGDMPPFTDWQQSELDRRERLYHDGRMPVLDAADVHAALRRGS